MSEKNDFERLYFDYRLKMFLLAKSILHNDHDAEDAVHDVFLNVALKHRETLLKLKSETDKKNYLLKSVKNTALNKIRGKKELTVFDDEIADFQYAGIENRDFFCEICNRLDYEELLRRIENLDEKYRDALYFHFVAELSVSETASLLGRSENTVKKQLVRGKKLLLENNDNKGGYENGNDKG